MTATQKKERILLVGSSSATTALAALLQEDGHTTFIELKSDWAASQLSALRPSQVIIAADLRPEQSQIVFHHLQLQALSQSIPVVQVTPNLPLERALLLLAQGSCGIVQTPCNKERTLQLLRFFSAQKNPGQLSYILDPRPIGSLMRTMRHAQAYGLTLHLTLVTSQEPAIIELQQGKILSFKRGAQSGQEALHELLSIQDQSLWKLISTSPNSTAVETNKADLLEQELTTSPKLGPPLKLASRAQRTALPPVRVLLADDEPSLLALYTKILTDDDFHVVASVQNGEAGLQATLEHRPDVIISDAMMPLKDGWNFLAELRADYRIHDIPFLMLSCQGDYLAQLLNLGVSAEDYLQKGIRSKEIKKRLKEALAPRLQFSAALDVTQHFSGSSMGLGPRFLLQSFENKNATGRLQFFARTTHYQILFSQGKITQISSNHDQSNIIRLALRQLLAENTGTYDFYPQSIPPTSEMLSFKQIQDTLAIELNQSVQNMLSSILQGHGKFIIQDPQKRDAFLAICSAERKQKAHEIFVGKPLSPTDSNRVEILSLVQQMLRLGIVQTQWSA